MTNPVTDWGTTNGKQDGSEVVGPYTMNNFLPYEINPPLQQ